MHKVAFPFCGSKARTSTCGRLVLYARRALFSRPSDARRAARIDRAIRAGLRATRIARAIRVGRRELTERFAASDANRQSDSRRAPRINRAIRVGRRESTEQSDPRRAPGGPGANTDQVGLHRPHSDPILTDPIRSDPTRSDSSRPQPTGPAPDPIPTRSEPV